MLRESTVHTDLSEMTMSMMREKQYEACERRLFAHPRAALPRCRACRNGRFWGGPIIKRKFLLQICF